jgi:hypothetical protein
MCSTTQSPRAANAFSNACAARRCPAPEDADEQHAGLVLHARALLLREHMESAFSFASGELFENAARDPLQFAKTGQIILKFGVHELRLLRT